MEENERQDTTAEPDASSGPLTWSNWSGWPVYGLADNVPPPDFATPWQFNPRHQPIALPAPPPNHIAPPQQIAAPQAHPQQMIPPPPMQYYVEPPSPLGPAKTPDERARELGIPIPPSDKE